MPQSYMVAGSDRIITEDGVEAREGDRVYNYYDMRPGIIFRGPELDPDSGFYGWFEFQADNGRTSILNGQRVCSMAYARRRGFPGADAA